MGKKNRVMNSQKESVQGGGLRKMLGKSPAEQWRTPLSFP